MQFRMDWQMVLLYWFSLGVLLGFWPSLQSIAGDIRIHSLLSNFVFSAVIFTAVLLLSYIIILIVNKVRGA